jgi:hypothetical protein
MFGKKLHLLEMDILQILNYTKVCANCIKKNINCNISIGKTYYVLCVILIFQIRFKHLFF